MNRPFAEPDLALPVSLLDRPAVLQAVRDLREALSGRATSPIRVTALRDALDR